MSETIDCLFLPPVCHLRSGIRHFMHYQSGTMYLLTLLIWETRISERKSFFGGGILRRNERNPRYLPSYKKRRRTNLWSCMQLHPPDGILRRRFQYPHSGQSGRRRKHPGDLFLLPPEKIDSASDWGNGRHSCSRWDLHGRAGAVWSRIGHWPQLWWDDEGACFQIYQAVYLSGVCG